MSGDAEDRSRLPECLGDTAAIRPQDGDTVDHGLDRHQRLILGDERRQETEACDSPESARVAAVLVEENVAVGAEVQATSGDVRLGPAASTARNGMSGRRRPSSSAIRVKTWTPFSIVGFTKTA